MSESKPMMQCGHAANAVDKDTGAPCCVICAGISGADYMTVVTTPDLTGRMARCGCGRQQPSSTGLAFFEHLPDKQYDKYYCGCRGWD